MGAQARGRATVKLKVQDFDRRLRATGLRGDSVIADAMGIDHSSLSRVRRGLQSPGERFIAGAIWALDCKFEDIFRVVRPETTTVKELPHGRRDGNDHRGEPDSGSGVALHA